MVNYFKTFITVAPDCPVEHSVIPTGKGDSPTVHQIQFDLLTEHPDTYTGEELIFQTHVRRLGLSEDEAETRRDEIWAELFCKDHACLRASALAKKYGWGFHYGEQGRIRIVSMESEDYAQYVSEEAGLKVLAAMRSKRA